MRLRSHATELCWRSSAHMSVSRKRSAEELSSAPRRTYLPGSGPFSRVALVTLLGSLFLLYGMAAVCSAAMLGPHVCHYTYHREVLPVNGNAVTVGIDRPNESGTFPLVYLLVSLAGHPEGYILQSVWTEDLSTRLRLARNDPWEDGGGFLFRPCEDGTSEGIGNPASRKREVGQVSRMGRTGATQYRFGLGYWAR